LQRYLDYRNLWDARIRINQLAYQASQFANRWYDASWRAYDIAWIYPQRGDTTTAMPWVEQANTAVAHSHDRRTQATMEHLRGIAYQCDSQLDQAEQSYQHSLAIYQSLGDQRTQSITLNDLGDIAQPRKQHQQAEQYYRQALDLARTLGDQGSQASYLANLGNLAIECQHFAEAAEHYHQATALARAIGRQETIASAQAEWLRHMSRLAAGTRRWLAPRRR
jgi:tetratricopeptide (TPR) repeat protein